MPRPQNKADLLAQSKLNFEKLFGFIDSFDTKEQEREFGKDMLNRNIKDVLFHLHEWHLMMLSWYEIGIKGDMPDIPAKEYTWQQIPELNKKLWEKHKSGTLKNARKLVEDSHEKMMKIINSHTSEDFFQKKKYKWTGTTSMGSYFVSATASHYDWAYKEIKKGLAFGDNRG